MPRVDYDRIAHLYDEPIRDHAPDEHFRRCLAARPDLDPASAHILDVGCGTGKQLVADRSEWPGAVLVGVDRFRGMLRVARRRGHEIGWIQGDGARLPLASDQFDYATNQFSYQHIAGRESFVHEMFRVLRPGGRFVMTNIDPWSMTGWSIYRYFPEALERDRLDFLPAESFAALMREAGFTDVQIERWERTQFEVLRDFRAYVSQRHRASQLMVISDTSYQNGLARLDRELQAAGDASPTGDSETCVVTIRGDRPWG
jgi:ubiquinone/menaquinone biosynthesis C-methylase UbiE